MLKLRVFTAIPLAAFVIWGLATQPSNNIFYALLFVALVSGWEWAQLSGVKNHMLRGLYALSIMSGTYVAQQLVSDNISLLNILLMITVITWCVVIYYMFSHGPKKTDHSISIIKLLVGFFGVIPPILALLFIHKESTAWLFYALSIVWVADIGAYFSGKRFGKKKLAPNLSPGKTQEGMIGAVFATTIYSALAGYYFQLDIISVIVLLLISIVATVISVAGDLSISLLKREMNLKDTGKILPGHGGILDRIDSVLSSAPFLALFLGWAIF